MDNAAERNSRSRLLVGILRARFRRTGFILDMVQLLLVTEDAGMPVLPSASSGSTMSSAIRKVDSESKQMPIGGALGLNL
ncbi:MAG: hypothetical protein C4K49_05930 [Candidatus Thorarchaeota archaeon]|nr:MAG: hypothetical protein C4K49_05930 [Candidatus Thorarchaeota archaeon]